MQPSFFARVAYSRDRLLNHPGHADQKSHGRRRKATGGPSGARGQDALDAVPLGALSASLSQRERRSLRAYAAPEHFEAINGSLRGGPPAGPTDRRHIANMDAVMNRSRLTADAETWRGVRSGTVALIGADRMAGNLKGYQWREDAYVSTSVRRSAAEEFAQGGPETMLMRITVAKGTGAAKIVDQVRDGEGEVVLQRGLNMRVTQDRGVDPDWGYRLIDVEVVPQ